MKKLVLILTLISLSIYTWAQDINITLGRSNLEQYKNYRRAIQYFDASLQDEKTRDSPDAWYWRGKAYLQWALDSTAGSKPEDVVPEAARSFVKAVDLKPDYGSEINTPMHTSAILSYNKGVVNFQNKLYAPAYENFMRVVTIYNAGGGNRFVSNAVFTSIIPDAKMYAAYAAENDNRLSDAQLLFEELIKIQAKKNADIYQALIELYQKQNKTAEMFALIKDARKQFPANKTFRDLELNYYINTGKQAELLPLLEAAVKQDPDNPELLYNLANVYMNLVFPIDANGNLLPAPANFKDLYLKTENAYKKAVKLKPDNADYNYNAGVLYYSNASVFNHQMTNITGTSPADNKKVNDLTVLRNAEFNKALPYFEKAYTILDNRSGSLSDTEKATYRNTLTGLKEIYSRLNKTAKADEVKKKLDELR